MSENIKTRKYYRVHNGTDWDRMHFVTDANSVDANDGDNMETKVGAIKGITTSTEVTEEGYAADATTVAALNSSLGGINFIVDDEKGITGYTLNGADTVYPFRKEPYLKLVSTARSFNISSIVGAENIAKYTKNDFIVCNTTASSGEGKLSTHNQGVTTACCATASYTKLSDPVVSYNASTGAVSISGGTYRTHAYLKKYNGSQYVTHRNPEPTDYNMSIAVYLLVKP